MSNLNMKLLALFVVASCIVAVHMQRVGGLGEEKPGDEEVTKVISLVQKAIREEYPRKFIKIEPIGYKTQTVAGKNYFIKALFHETNGDKVVAHLRIYKSFRGNAELASIKVDVKNNDSIEYFE